LGCHDDEAEAGKSTIAVTASGRSRRRGSVVARRTRAVEGFSCDDVMPLVESLPAVQLCHSVAGDTDLMVLVHAYTPTALADLGERIAAYKGVDDVTTVPVLRVMVDRR
jgi:DNA-binding Lrp family transcriptional regulator